MLTPEDNELLVRTGRGTSMGNLLRRFWVPALLSSELADRDGPPVRVELLGEVRSIDFMAPKDMDVVTAIERALPEYGQIQLVD